MADLRELAAELDRQTADWPGLTVELAGAVFGALTVEAPGELDAEGYVRVWCRCSCGRLALRRVVDLLEGRTEACRVCVEPPRPPPPPPPSKQVPLKARDPEAWERHKRAARDRRRERRANDPAFRDREAGYARAYRRRRRRPARPCVVCGRPCPTRHHSYCSGACKARRARQRAAEDEERGERGRRAA